MLIKINRDSVCMGDDMEDHFKIYDVDDTATYEDFFHVLKKDNYFPNIAGNNVVWVLTTYQYPCIFSYFTRTDKFSAGLVQKKMKELCLSGEVFLKYYPCPEKWKERILHMYQGNTYELWHDGWFEEVNYCDYLMELKDK